MKYEHLERTRELERQRFYGVTGSTKPPPCVLWGQPMRPFGRMGFYWGLISYQMRERKPRASGWSNWRVISGTPLVQRHS